MKKSMYDSKTCTIAKSNRIEEIDIVKGLSIVCVVAGHAGAPFTHFIYLFHMAAFFMVSGFVFSEKASDSIKDVLRYILKQIKRLWVPYFVYSSIFTVLNNAFVRSGIYASDKCVSLDYPGQYSTVFKIMSIREIIKRVLSGFAFLNSTQLGSAFWFFKCLFMVAIGYCFVNYFAKTVSSRCVLYVQLFVSSFLLMFGYYCSLHELFLGGVARAASCYCLFYAGHLFRSIWRKDSHQIKGTQIFTVFIVSFIALLFLNNAGGVSLNVNSYTNPIYLLVSSFFGWFFLLSTAFGVAYTPFRKLLIEIGQRTVPIVAMHFLAFKLIAVVITRVYGMPLGCVASFPNLMGDKGFWWLAYTIVGVGIPILVDALWKHITTFLATCK